MGEATIEAIPVEPTTVALAVAVATILDVLRAIEVALKNTSQQSIEPERSERTYLADSTVAVAVDLIIVEVALRTVVELRIAVELRIVVELRRGIVVFVLASVVELRVVVRVTLRGSVVLVRVVCVKGSVVLANVVELVESRGMIVELKLMARAAELVTLKPEEFDTIPTVGAIAIGEIEDRFATIAAITTGSLLIRRKGQYTNTIRQNLRELTLYRLRKP